MCGTMISICNAVSRLWTLRKRRLIVANGFKRTLPIRQRLVAYDGSPLRGEDLKESPLFSMPVSNFIQLLADAYRPELIQLQDPAAPTPEGHASAERGIFGPNRSQSPSQFLYGSTFLEVDRTLTSLLLLWYIVNDDYNGFTECQDNDRLSRDSFIQFRNYLLDGNSIDIYLLIVETVIGDLGKYQTLTTFSSTEQPDHDVILFEAAQAKKVDLLDEFKDATFHTFLASLCFDSKFNVSHLVQCENVPGDLAKVPSIRDINYRVLNLHLKAKFLDVAGAAGHVNSRGSQKRS